MDQGESQQTKPNDPWVLITKKLFFC